MILTLLGTGTSGGVPVLGCQCEVCRSTNPMDNRSRCAALVETENHRVLIDCGPDIRQQLLRVPFKKIDAVLLTHIHYDHVAGIDDLRPYCRFGDIDLYGNHDTAAGLKHNMPYCFTDKLYPGVPLLKLHAIAPHQQLKFGDIDVVPIEVLHGDLPILGYRFGKLAYITDMKSISHQNLMYLTGIEILIVNALRFNKPHHSHQLVDDAVKFAQKIGAKRTIFIHVTHDIGFHDSANACLPEGFEFGYDGMQVEWDG